MSDATVQLDALIDRYLAGGQEFQDFWAKFMDLYGDADLSAGEETAYEDAYDAVYMGAGGSVSVKDQALGLLSEDEVKVRLRGFRARSAGRAPA